LSFASSFQTRIEKQFASWGNLNLTIYVAADKNPIFCASTLYQATEKMKSKEIKDTNENLKNKMKKNITKKQ
jgi:hypothetical protein